MSTTNNSYSTDAVEVPLDHFPVLTFTTRYENAKVSDMHLDPVRLPYASVLKKRGNWYWKQLLHDKEWSVNRLGYALGLLLETAPATLDTAFEVDEGGFTKQIATHCFSTQWVPLSSIHDQLFVRFSQARTADHVTGVLRTPVMGGYALEVTGQPQSTDPRDVVTLVVYGKQKEKDANQSWIKPRDVQIFDFTQFSAKPYFAGPLYGGHPNQVTDPEMLKAYIAQSRELILKILSA